MTAPVHPGGERKVWTEATYNKRTPDRWTIDVMDSAGVVCSVAATGPADECAQAAARRLAGGWAGTTPQAPTVDSVPDAVKLLADLANDGGTESIPSVDVCGFCWDSECDGIGCIANLDPDCADDHPKIERLHALLRAGHALRAAAGVSSDR